MISSDREVFIYLSLMEIVQNCLGIVGTSTDNGIGPCSGQ